MSEQLTSRVGRVLSGTVNMLVDAFEDMAPEVVMEQAIREIDQAIDEVRAELGKVIAKKHLATTRLAEENRKHEELSEKVRLAIDEGREDLAEAAVARLLDIEAQIPVLEATITQAKESETEMERFVSALKARKREMRDELAQYRATVKQPSSPAASGHDGTPPSNVVDTAVMKAESAFDRVLERTSGVAGASRPEDREAATRLAELDDLERANRVKERLATFKAAGERD